MKTAVFSAVYPGVEKFLPEFLNSLSKQTDNSFVLFLINDGMEGLEGFLGQASFPIRIKDGKGPSAATRKTGIEWMKYEGVEIVVFADADDHFSENRVEVAKKLLLINDMVFNELILFGEQCSSPVPMLTNFYKNNEEITAKGLVNYNCLGMSNTSVRIDKIPEQMTMISDNQISFDWAIFSLVLNSGTKAIFTKEANTWYRQHRNNTASPLLFSDMQILRGVRVKRDHYCLLSKWYADYKNLAKEFTQLLEMLSSDSLLKERYCTAVRKHFSRLLLRWWEPIKPLEELR